MAYKREKPKMFTDDDDGDYFEKKTEDRQNHEPPNEKNQRYNDFSKLEGEASSKIESEAIKEMLNMMIPDNMFNHSIFEQNNNGIKITSVMGDKNVASIYYNHESDIMRIKAEKEIEQKKLEMQRSLQAELQYYRNMHHVSNMRLQELEYMSNMAYVNLQRQNVMLLRELNAVKHNLTQMLPYLHQRTKNVEKLPEPYEDSLSRELNGAIFHQKNTDIIDAEVVKYVKRSDPLKSQKIPYDDIEIRAFNEPNTMPGISTNKEYSYYDMNEDMDTDGDIEYLSHKTNRSALGANTAINIRRISMEQNNLDARDNSGSANNPDLLKPQDGSSSGNIPNFYLIDGVYEILPEDGNTALQEEDCKECIPRYAPGWIETPYCRKQFCKVDIGFARKCETVEENEENSSITYEIDDERSEQINMSIYWHDVPSSYIRSKNNAGKYLWDVVDIPFNPAWKEIAAKYFNGISNCSVLIVRLLSNMTELGKSQDYITMYVNGNLYSQKFDKAMEDFAKAGTVPTGPLNISYNENMINNPDFAHMISAFMYAFKLNKDNCFTIIEQLADFKYEGKRKVLLSANEPKTEIREEFNIFKTNNASRSIYTNIRTKLFMCTHVGDQIIITRRKLSNRFKKYDKS